MKLRELTGLLLTSMLIAASMILPGNNAVASSPGRIACASWVGSSGGGGIWVLNGDGANLTKISNDGVSPTWCLDGLRLLFLTNGDVHAYMNIQDMYVMNTDGTNRVRLMHGQNPISNPVWSPDGSKILFAMGPNGDDTLYTINADGSNQISLNVKGESPSFSPDGAKIAFYKYDDGIYIATPDGSNPTRILAGNDCRNPTWSPDGTKIAYDRAYSANGIYVMAANGTNSTKLVMGSRPAWSPDGTKIAFITPQANIAVINIDGSNQVNLTNGGQYDNGRPQWFAGAWIAPTIVTSDATMVTNNSTRLVDQLSSLGSAAGVVVTFQSGIVSGNYSNETSAQTVTAAGTNFTDLGGLYPNTTYYFRAKAVGNGTSYGTEKTFKTLTPPLVVTNTATGATTNSVTLNGNLAGLGTASTANVYFTYGTTPGGPYPAATAPSALTAIGAFNTTVNGLAAGTTYYFQAVADGGVNGTAYGSQQTFITGVTAPSVTTNAANNITTIAATLNGSLSALGTASAVNVSFRYGTTLGGPYPSTTAPSTLTAAGAFNTTITGLTASTTYYYQAVANGGVSGTSFGTEQTFTTGAIPSPTVTSPSVTTNSASSITVNAATLNGSLSALGTASAVNVSFRYGTTPGGPYSATTAPSTLTAAGAFNTTITGLTASTTYYYQAMANGGASGFSYGTMQTFTTSAAASVANPPTTPTTSSTTGGTSSSTTVSIPAVTTNATSSVTTNAATLTGNLTSLGAASTVNVYFRYGTTPGGPYPSTTGPLTRSSIGAFNTSISGLATGTTYYYQAVANGGVTGTSYGIEQGFTTGSLPAPTSIAQTPISVTAKQLYDDYQANEVAADQKYKGKVIQVTGEVSGIKKDIYNQPYVELSAGLLGIVECTFGKSNESQLAQLVRSQNVVIQGRCTGKLIFVSLDNCSVVQSNSASTDNTVPATQSSENTGSHCFIATAAYGSETAEQLDTLRAFRDKVLMKTEPGRWFVNTYYQVSPPLAHFIADKDVLRATIRFELLDPIVLILRNTQQIWNE